MSNNLHVICLTAYYSKQRNNFNLSFQTSILSIDKIAILLYNAIIVV